MSDRESRTLKEVADALDHRGVGRALELLNQRTTFRFTGIYRFDGEVLRNVALFDRWQPGQYEGADAPMSETFCAITAKQARPLEVADGRIDGRFPWMQGNAVASYCGAPILGEAGSPVGTVCHFDLQPCQAQRDEVDLLARIAGLFLPFVLMDGQGP